MRAIPGAGIPIKLPREQIRLLVRDTAAQLGPHGRACLQVGNTKPS